MRKAAVHGIHAVLAESARLTTEIQLLTKALSSTSASQSIASLGLTTALDAAYKTCADLQALAQYLRTITNLETHAANVSESHAISRGQIVTQPFRKPHDQSTSINRPGAALSKVHLRSQLEPLRTKSCVVLCKKTDWAVQGLEEDIKILKRSSLGQLHATRSYIGTATISDPLAQLIAERMSYT